jgi:hypothetical protein
VCTALPAADDAASAAESLLLQWQNEPEQEEPEQQQQQQEEAQPHQDHEIFHFAAKYSCDKLQQMSVEQVGMKAGISSVKMRRPCVYMQPVCAVLQEAGCLLRDSMMLCACMLLTHRAAL